MDRWVLSTEEIYQIAKKTNQCLAYGRKEVQTVKWVNIILVQEGTITSLVETT